MSPTTLSAPSTPELTLLALEHYNKPLLELLYEAHSVHREYHAESEIQKCVLLSIKTGGCPEDCGYCSQSAHHDSKLPREPLVSVETVREAAQRAKEAGAQRFCMGAAWRQAPEGEPFDRVLQMVREVKALGMEACVTLGMLNPEQAVKLKEAGLDAYNHNLDTSRTHYPNIISTRTYDDRLDTIHSARAAGLTVCSGGILGLGESVDDRCAMLAELASLDPQPESVPINLLMPMKGTPLQDAPQVPIPHLIRTIAVARLMMPKARVRLSAGRITLSQEAQILAFFAGANSIFIGDKLLTASNSSLSGDQALFAALSGSSAHAAN
ncbi:biotin synthase BioB [Silvibacterium acidisoli]|uniref:biotin synthase BioB n=1 Tax=Acidobacteriaceae bacterium ZG23-2 TaxID=2883246 RepID=UPI00406C609F